MLARSLAVAGLVIASSLLARSASADEVAPPPAPVVPAAPPPIVVVVQPAPPVAAKRAKKPKVKRKRDVPLAIFGGTLVGIGGVTALTGFIGYLSSVHCSPGFILPTCRDEPMWWAAVGTGFAVAGLAGTPALVAGLKGHKLPEDGAPETSAELLVGPTSAGFRLHF